LAFLKKGNVEGAVKAIFMRAGEEGGQSERGGDIE
jgi:hypothetical protein